MKQRRLVTGVVAGIATMALTAAPALAAGWKLSADTGRAEVCFEPQDLNDKVALEQMRLAAQAWNAATTKLSVTAIDCGPEDNVVPMVIGPSVKNILGTTFWNEDRAGNITSAAQSFAAQSVVAFGRATGSVPAAWRGVMAHEMGHALGLPHSDDPNSCMQTGTKRPFPFPAQSDFAELRSIYGGVANSSVRIPPVEGLPAFSNNNIPRQALDTSGTPLSNVGRPLVNPNGALGGIPVAPVAPATRSVGRVIPAAGNSLGVVGGLGTSAVAPVRSPVPTGAGGVTQTARFMTDPEDPGTWAVRRDQMRAQIEETSGRTGLLDWF